MTAALVAPRPGRARRAKSGGVRRLAVVLLALLCAVLAPGCAALEAVTDTQAALEAAGYRDASVSWYSVNGVETVVVTWTAGSETAEGLDIESLGAAGVIWRVAPVYFDLVETDPDVTSGDLLPEQRTYPRSQLEHHFGPRPAGLDKDAGELVNFRGIIVGVVVAGVLGVVLTVLVIVVIVRAMGKRRAAAPAPGYPPPGWPPPPGAWPPGPQGAPRPGGWPQPPPQPGGWPPGPPQPGGWPPGPPPAAPYGTPPGPPPADPWAPPPF